MNEQASKKYPLPLVINAPASGDDLLQWLERNAEAASGKLPLHGAILFRGFAHMSAAEFEQAAGKLSDVTFNNVEESSPRSKISGNVFTSTDYRSDENIFLHNENSYMQSFPNKLFFYCDQPSPVGGQTPLADCRRIYKRLPADVVSRFLEKKWMYVRNYGTGIGMTWQEAFKTTREQDVEDYCHAADIAVEWVSDEHLRTRQIREAALKHPVTGERSWFNHITFFHYSTLPESVREALLSICGEEGLPNNTHYGDGSRIEDDVLALLRQAYLEETVDFSWQKGDLVLLDNLITAHSREPFEGERRIMFLQADPIQRHDLVIG